MHILLVPKDSFISYHNDKLATIACFWKLQFRSLNYNFFCRRLNNSQLPSTNSLVRNGVNCRKLSTCWKILGNIFQLPVAWAIGPARHYAVLVFTPFFSRIYLSLILMYHMFPLMTHQGDEHAKKCGYECLHNSIAFLAIWYCRDRLAIFRENWQ